ncbi:MAG: cytochrome c maturation protein CcmE [Candidatus Poribacteria bacterium]
MESRILKFVVAGVLLTAGVGALMFTTLKNPDASLTRYTPDQLLMANAQDVAARGVQVDGYVAEGTERYDMNAKELRFEVRDMEKTAFVKVVYREGLKPDTFAEGQGVVVSGKYDPELQIIEADKLMTKCPSKYEAEEPASGETVSAVGAGS